MGNLVAKSTEVSNHLGDHWGTLLGKSSTEGWLKAKDLPWMQVPSSRELGAWTGWRGEKGKSQPSVHHAIKWPTLPYPLCCNGLEGKLGLPGLSYFWWALCDNFTRSNWQKSWSLISLSVLSQALIGWIQTEVKRPIELYHRGQLPGHTQEEEGRKCS